MFVEETQSSSCLGPWWCDRNLKRCYRFTYKLLLLPLEPFVLAALGALWPGARPSRTPAPGGKPRAHLAPPDLPFRHTQANASENLCLQPSTLFHRHMEAEFKKIQWPRGPTTGARHMAGASGGRAPRLWSSSPMWSGNRCTIPRCLSGASSENNGQAYFPLA